MKVLILSCNTGEGHNSVAAAIREEFEAHGDVCLMEDTLSFLSPRVSRLICRWHARVYRYLPGAFRRGYRAAEQHPRLFRRRSAVTRLLARGVERLAARMRAEKVDLVVCPHVFSALLMTVLRERYPALAPRFCFIATDYTCSPIVAECDADWFFIPREDLRADFIAKGVPGSRIIVSGIPVRRAFFVPADRESARAACGVPTGTKHILLMNGSMGCGPMEETVAALEKILPAGALLTVVCGTNEHLFRRLKRSCGASVRVLGYADNVAALLASADVFLTKPGGISVSEAAALGVPMLLADTVSGCESYNLAYFVGHGAALAADVRFPGKTAAQCVTLLSDGDALGRLRERVRALSAPDAAKVIRRNMTGIPENGTAVS